MSDGFLQQLFAGGIGGLIVAGAAFALNFWKGERDIRRANLERLYTAVYKYTKVAWVLVYEVRTNSFDPAKDRGDLEGQVDLINVLIDLYFPELKADFDSYKSGNEDFIVSPQQVLRRDRNTLRKDLDRIISDGEKFKQSIVQLARKLEIFPAG